MSFVDWIRELFRGKQSSAEYGALAGGTAAATDDSKGDHESHSDAGWFDGGDSGGSADGGGGSGSSG
jgi:hypothetical protein